MINTATVSPSARPKPESIAPAIIPLRPCGKTVIRMTSPLHRAQRLRRLDVRWRQVEHLTRTEVMIGRIITDNTTRGEDVAPRQLSETLPSANRKIQFRCVLGHCGNSSQRRKHEDSPQTEHDRGTAASKSTRMANGRAIVHQGRR